jgi:hypothetical protein
VVVELFKRDEVEWDELGLGWIVEEWLGVVVVGHMM